MVTTDDAAPAVIEPVLAPGALIGGRYRIEARLGAGGGGTVFRCVDQQLGDKVALKVVSGDGDLDRWRREVAMARQITDRNVCRVHDLGETRELRYVTMELVEGTSLRAKIGKVEAAEARALIEQLIDGVAAIHAGGVVHRDLKPENVVVTPEGRPVIVDFGLAKTPRRDAATSLSMPAASSEAVTKPLKGEPALAATERPPAPLGATITRAGFAVGTPRYMSPEQASAEAVDARTDIWALGLVAHELLTGEMPVLEADGAIVASRVDEHWPGFGPVLGKCLALEPKDRFADARALKLALPGTKPSIISKLPAVFALVGAIAVIGFIVAKIVRGDGEPTPALPADTSSKMLQVTSTLDKQWPRQSPVSVALDATATQLAYTTGGGALYVRPVAGGSVVEWPAPALAGVDHPRALLGPAVVGWFSDGSLAITGSTSTEHQLVRMRADGTATPLHHDNVRFHVAMAGGKIAVADRTIHELEGAELAAIPAGSRVVALAWHGDKLAWLRVSGPEMILELAGAQLWRGTSQLVIDPLLVTANHQLVFSFRDAGTTTIAAIDPVTKLLAVLEQTPALVGAGSAAGGVLAVIRGNAREVIQIRDRFGGRTVQAHGPTQHGTEVAGWTTGGAVVMRVDDRVMTGETGNTGNSKSWRLAPWQGARADDVPVAVLGDDVLVRHPDGDAWQIDRITPAGARSSYSRIPNATAFHCAIACVVQQRDGGDAMWSELGPAGELRAPLYRRRAIDTPRFALSQDLLVIATDGQLIAIDRKTGAPVAPPPAAAIATRWGAIGFDGDGELWAASESLGTQPFGLVRYRRRTDAFGRPSSLVTEKDDALRLFGTPYPTGTERDMRIAVPAVELVLEIWRADAPR